MPHLLPRRAARLARGRRESLDLLRGAIFANLRKIARDPTDNFVVDQCRHNIRNLKLRYRAAIADLAAYPHPELPTEVTVAGDILLVAVSNGFIGKRMRASEMAVA